VLLFKHPLSHHHQSKDKHWQMAKDMKESRSSRKGCLTPPEHEEVMSLNGVDG
jgi:hypothetical protein